MKSGFQSKAAPRWSKSSARPGPGYERKNTIGFESLALLRSNFYSFRPGGYDVTLFLLLAGPSSIPAQTAERRWNWILPRWGFSRLIFIFMKKPPLTINREEDLPAVGLCDKNTYRAKLGNTD